MSRTDIVIGTCIGALLILFGIVAGRHQGRQLQQCIVIMSDDTPVAICDPD